METWTVIFISSQLQRFSSPISELSTIQVMINTCNVEGFQNQCTVPPTYIVSFFIDQLHENISQIFIMQFSRMCDKCYGSICVVEGWWRQLVH